MALSDAQEHAVIAAPSIVHSAVAVALTSVADASLVVVRQGKSQISDVVEAKMTLEAMGVPAIGMVLLTGEVPDEPAEHLLDDRADAVTLPERRSQSFSDSREDLTTSDRPRRRQAPALICDEVWSEVSLPTRSSAGAPARGAGSVAISTAVDQVLSSASNALMVFVLAQVSSAGQFGIIGLLITVLAVCTGFNRGALGTPLLLTSNLKNRQIVAESGYAAHVVAV